MTETFVSHLECSLTGKRYEARQVHGLSDAGRPLLVRYDLEKMGRAFTKVDLAATREPGFWRYAPMLPVERPENRVSLGEVVTPLIPLQRSAAALGGRPGKAIVKDEGRLPTGSFKARGLCLAVSMAKEFGLQHLAIPTNGNAGAAMAAYASRAGLRSTVFCPDDTPEINVREIQQLGAQTWLVNGLINDCGKIVGGGKEAVGWFDVSTLKEPYRIEGKKTMGLELAEQMGWKLPDAILYPTGGGTGLIGMWKAFQELLALGWIEGHLPRMIAVQAEGCAPIVEAWKSGAEHAPLWENAHTVAAGIRVPIAVGDFLIIRAVRESNGFCMAVSDDDIMAARDLVAREDGLLLCPEGAATAVAYQTALETGQISQDETVVLYNCATGLKYPMAPVERTINRFQPVAYDMF
ncbi:threonine synthase [Alsobacter metallidurans]|uniref:Threonine synthase n=1 Tax=Alsobacter metallidurans TaxID=340221 RepID=A0A917MJ11_9HYPH|nr:threonine synthase [Alsobacter metallidurans]GGH27837.1 threonine synthase [Alsobacter metallidurans]